MKQFNETIIRMFLNGDRIERKCDEKEYKIVFGYHEVIYIDKYLSTLNSEELYNKIIYIIDNIDLREKLLWKIIEVKYYDIIKRIKNDVMN